MKGLELRCVESRFGGMHYTRNPATLKFSKNSKVNYAYNTLAIHFSGMWSLAQLLVALPYSANPGFTPTRITAFGFTIETSVPWLNPDEGSQADVHPDDISAHHSLLHDALLAPGRRPVRHFHHAAGPAKTTSDRPAVVR